MNDVELTVVMRFSYGEAPDEEQFRQELEEHYDCAVITIDEEEV